MTIGPIGRHTVAAVGGSGGDGSDNQESQSPTSVRLGGGHQVYEIESSDTCCDGCISWLRSLWRAVRSCFGGAQETRERSSSVTSLLDYGFGMEPGEDSNEGGSPSTRL